MKKICIFSFVLALASFSLLSFAEESESVYQCKVSCRYNSEYTVSIEKTAQNLNDALVAVAQRSVQLHCKLVHEEEMGGYKLLGPQDLLDNDGMGLYSPYCKKIQVGSALSSILASSPK